MSPAHRLVTISLVALVTHHRVRGDGHLHGDADHRPRPGRGPLLRPGVLGHAHHPAARHRPRRGLVRPARPAALAVRRAGPDGRRHGAGRAGADVPRAAGRSSGRRPRRRACSPSPSTSSSAAPTPATLRPRVFSWISAAWVLPSLVGPPVAGWLAETFSWRWVFLVVVVPVAVTMVVVASRRETMRDDSDRELQPDPAGRAAPAGRSSGLVVAVAAGAMQWGAESLVPVRVLPLVATVAGLAGVLAASPRLVPRGTLRMARGPAVGDALPVPAHRVLQRRHDVRPADADPQPRARRDRRRCHAHVGASAGRPAPGCRVSTGSPAAAPAWSRSAAPRSPSVSPAWPRSPASTCPTAWWGGGGAVRHRHGPGDVLDVGALAVPVAGGRARAHVLLAAARRCPGQRHGHRRGGLGVRRAARRGALRHPDVRADVAGPRRPSPPWSCPGVSAPGRDRRRSTRGSTGRARRPAPGRRRGSPARTPRTPPRRARAGWSACRAPQTLCRSAATACAPDPSGEPWAISAIPAAAAARRSSAVSSPTGSQPDARRSHRGPPGADRGRRHRQGGDGTALVPRRAGR